MAAAAYDLYIEQGATFRFTMIYGRRDGTVDADGNPVVIPYDITGCAARMQIRQRRGAVVAAAATTTNGGIVFDNPTTGKMVITFTDELTQSLTFKRAQYDLELAFPSGDVLRILEGKITVSPNITQPSMLDNISEGDTTDYDLGDQEVSFDPSLNTPTSWTS